MRRGRLKRLMRLGGMAAGLAADAAGAAGDLVAHGNEKAQELFHRQSAERLLRVLGEMKGLPLKAGQLLSYIDEAIPPEHRKVYEEVLGRLQHSSPPVAWEEMEVVLREELGDLGKHFADFDQTPIAAASIGQVYRAELHDGRQVVVKVQYPGIAEAFEADLANVDVLVSTFDAVLPGLSFRDFVGDIIERVNEELDYIREAENQAAFAAAWAEDPFVRVPTVFPELSTRRVLTSSYADGLVWADMLATADAALKQHYGREIFRFVFRSLFIDGMFNADPHPGNYLFHEDGCVTFIDYGCVVRFGEGSMGALLELRDLTVARNTGEAWKSSMIRAFGVPGELDAEVVEVLANYVRLTVEPVTAEPQPYRFTRAYSTKLVQEMLVVKARLNKALFTRRRADIWGMEDTGVVFLGRIAFGLGAILATLEAEGDFNRIVAEM